MTAPSDADREIYHDDVVVEWPQSGERVCGRANLHALRSHHPSTLRFTTRRILGGGDLWVTEYLITYTGDGKVARETHYFAEPFDAPGWRAQWVERMPGGT